MRKRNVIAVLAFLCLPVLSVLAQNNSDEVLKYSMKTRWTDDVNPNKLYPEYPRPQMVRNEDDWVNLNGYWEYSIKSKGEKQPSGYDGKILVPFPVESELSEVKKLVGKNNYLWYKRSFRASKSEGRTILHFGAVDWEATVYVNGKEVGTHKGGYDSFSFDITKFLKNRGEQELVVRVWDPTDSGMQARGKQLNNPRGIWYTPVTGIWQTVWMENVPEDYITQLKITPDVDNRMAKIKVDLSALKNGGTIEAKIFEDGKQVSSQEKPVGEKSESSYLELGIEEPILWTPDNPFLYDIKIALKDAEGNVVDKVDSYTGMRKVSLGKDANGYTRIMLNDVPLFQFGLLDQGWWPDGLYTAPTEEAMIYDIKVTQELGFNMLRKHVKVEPARFYYHCDKMGMLVWQDMPSGFIASERDTQHVQHDAKVDWERPLASSVQFERELKAMIDNLYNFPSILLWVPLNEGWGQYDTKRLAEWTKAYDPSRLVDAPSGWADRKVGDMIDVHLYPGPGMELSEKNRASVLGEFGGLGWPVDGHRWWDKRNWGYLTFEDEDTYQKEFKALIENLQGLISWGLSAAIYTQTTDVEGEVNGVMTYDREVLKLDKEETRELLKPLYKSWWNKRALIADSEHKPNNWKVSFGNVSPEWNQADFDDFEWEEKTAPFSANPNPFLPAFSNWNSNELYARKTFVLNSIPENIFIKYYAPKTEVELYVNGNLVEVLKEGGGRKRHYTHVLLKEIGEYLKTGENTLAVKAISENDIRALDLGLYTTQTVEEELE